MQIQIFFSTFLTILGFFLLVRGSDFFVDGASSLAKKLKVSAMIIGLTIVSIGTGTPELLVSISASIQNKSDLILGNILGSNIFNILIILGICSLITPLAIKSNTVWKEIPFSVLGTLILILIPLSINHFNIEQNVVLNFASGLILFSIYLIFIYYIFESTKNKKPDTQLNKEIKDEYTNKKLTTSIFLIITGLISLVYGGNLVVEYTTFLALSFGINEKIVGLTIISIGTGLPELVTSIQASLRKEYSIAVGNVIGSNIMNILLVLPISLFINPIIYTKSHFIESLILLAITLILFLSMFIFKKFTLGKVEGIALITFYLIFLFFYILRIN
jgi:cation:H+ antiporter